MWVLLLSLFVSLVLVHVLEGESSDALVALSVTFASVLVSSLVDVARLIAGAVIGLPVWIVTHPIYITRLLGIVGLAVACHEFHLDLLTAFDLFFRHVLSPSVHFLYSMTFLARVVWEPLAVFYNWWVAVSKTATLGTLALVTKCNIQLFTQMAKATLEIFLLFFQALFTWLGGGGGTFITNTFPWESTLEGIQVLIATTTELLDCACAELGALYRVGIATLTPAALARMGHHTLNAPLAAVQEAINTLRFESYPTLRKPAYHVSAAVAEFGLWIDAALLGAADVMLKDVLKQEGIPESERPGKFVGSALAGLLQAGVQTLYLSSRAAVHFALPLRLGDPEYVWRMLNPTEPVVWLREASDAAVLSGYWLLEYGYARISGGTPPTRLDCARTPQFYGDQFFNSLFCAARRGLHALTTVLAVGVSLPVEFGVMTLLAGGERNGFTTLQRYDGALRFPNALTSSNCELRQKVAAPEGWDMSTDAAYCDCGDPDRAFVVPAFDETKWSSLTLDRNVWCGQPQLQDAFRDLVAATEHFSHVVVPFVSPALRVGVGVLVQTWSAGLRLVLSAGDIVSGDFFELPLTGEGSGYGAREDLALRKWTLEGNALEDAACPEGYVRETAVQDENGNSKCMEVQNVARLHRARLRRYTGDVGLCRTSNADAGCRCNAALPLEPGAQCQCAIVFADDEVTHTHSYGEARWRRREFREGGGYCATNLFEPLFEMLERQAGEAVGSLVDALHPGSTGDWCPRQEYLVVQTDVSQFTERDFEETFLPDRAEWQKEELLAMIEARVAQRQQLRLSAGLAELTGLDLDDMQLEETKYTVAYEMGARMLTRATALCDEDASSAVLAGCLVDEAHQRSLELAKYDDRMCRVYGFHDFVCSVNDVVSKSVDVLVGTSRQVVNTVLAVVTGHEKAATFDVGNRLCDLQQSFGAQASALTSFLPVEKPLRKALTKFLFLVLEVPVEAASTFNSVLVLVDKLVKGTLFGENGKSADKAVHEFAEGVVEAAFKWWSLVFEALGDAVESKAEGGGALLYVLRDLSLLIGQVLNDAVVDTALAYVKTIVDMIAVFSGEADRMPSFVAGTFMFIAHVKRILPRVAMKTMGAVLQSLGPVGEFIAELAGSVCWILENILSGIAHAINAVSLGTADMDTDIDLGCLSGFFGADDDGALNATLRGTSRGMNELPTIVYELGGWDGMSFCDGIVRGYAEDAWRDLSPLEQESLTSCLKQRYLGAQIALQTGIPSLFNVVYDWVSRAHAMQSLARASFAYAEGLSPRDAREWLTQKEYDEYLPAVRRWVVGLTTTLTPERVSELLSSAAAEVGNALRASGPTGAQIMRAASGVSTLARGSAKHLRALPGAARQTLQGLRSIARTPNPSSETSDDAPRRRSLFAHPVLDTAKRKWRTVATAAQNVARDANTYVMGAAGIGSNSQDPCANSIVCLNCDILDNIFETATQESIRAALFLKYYYAEVTVPIFARHVRQKALALTNGVVEGAKDVFSDVNVPRPENAAEEFDRLVRAAGAHAAFAAVSAANGAQQAAGVTSRAIKVLETALAVSSSQALNRTSSTTDALDGLRERAQNYSFGSDAAAIDALLRRDLTAPRNKARRTVAQRMEYDWQYLWRHFPYVPANTTEFYVTNTEETKVKQISLVRATAMWLSTTSAPSEGGYVPLYGRGLFYSVSRLVLPKCDMDAQVYAMDGSTQTDRMDRFDEALWLTLWLTVAAVAAQAYFGFGFPILALLSPFIGAGVWYMWMYMLYGWSVNCAPSVPVMLGADVTAFVQSRMHPEPLCMRFSALATECDLSTGLARNNRTTWHDCFEDPAIGELGYAYSFVYYLRDLAPDVYRWFRETQPWRYWLSEWKVLDLVDDTSVPLRENCARLLLLDAVALVVAGGTAIFLTVSLLVPPVIALLRAAVQISLTASGLANLLVISITKREFQD